MLVHRAADLLRFPFSPNLLRYLRSCKSRIGACKHDIGTLRIYSHSLVWDFTVKGSRIRIPTIAAVGTLKQACLRGSYDDAVISHTDFWFKLIPRGHGRLDDALLPTANQASVVIGCGNRVR